MANGNFDHICKRQMISKKSEDEECCFFLFFILLPEAKLAVRSSPDAGALLTTEIASVTHVSRQLLEGLAKRFLLIVLVGLLERQRSAGRGLKHAHHHHKRVSVSLRARTTFLNVASSSSRRRRRSLGYWREAVKWCFEIRVPRVG